MNKLKTINEQAIRKIVSECLTAIYEGYYQRAEDCDDVDSINFRVKSTYDQDELDEELAEQDFSSEQEKQEFIEDYKKSNTCFECEFYDIDSERVGGYDDSLDYMEMDLPEDIFNVIMTEFNKAPNYDGTKEYHIDDILYSQCSDLSPEEAAKRMLKTCDYCFKGMHGFILKDGTIVLMSPGADHNQIECINGVDSKWAFTERGNISVFSNDTDLDLRIGGPITYEQSQHVRKLVAMYDTIYVDLFANGTEYTGCFRDVSPQYFCNVFERYYREGILPEELIN